MGTTRTRKTHRWSVGLAAAFFLLASSSLSFASPEELKAIEDQIRAKGRRWLAQETEVSRLPDHERKMRLGLLQPAAASAVGEEAAAESAPGTGVVPASFDWRNYNGFNYVTPVRDQKSCGSCWAFATTAALEANLLVSTGSGNDFAEQILVSCSGAGGCNGGYIDLASNFIRDTGLPGEGAFPYAALDSACAEALAGWQTATSGITSWHYVAGTTAPTAAQLKQELVTYGPLVTTFTVYSDFYYYAGGVYKYTSGTKQGGHAVLIVGFDDPGQYFIVKNSWGGTWGEAGYFKIAYSEMASVAAFGLWSQAYFTDTAQPSITVKTPNGGEARTRGTTTTIQWTYTGQPGAAVALALYDNGVFVSTISSSAPIGSGGAGSYSWNIPATLPTGSLYQIGIVSTADPAYADMSDGFFSVAAPVPPSIVVVAPNGGERWARGTSQRISWGFAGSPGTYVKIELLKSGQVVSRLSSKTKTAAGAYIWRIPTRQAAGADYTIRITSTANGAYLDTSDGPFAIQ